MYIYIIRHGQSLGNLKGGFAGHTDYPLSELGHKQARMTADFLKNEHVDLVISSPLSRAMQTAEPIAKDRGLKIIPEKEFMEMNFGDWKNMTTKNIDEQYNGAFTLWKNEMYKTVCPNGESTMDCYNRAVKALEATAHGAIIKCLCCYLHNVPIENLQDIPWADNASVTKLEYEDGKFSFVYECKSDHMGEFVTGVSNAMKKA